jgi:hypothetical protein
MSDEQAVGGNAMLSTPMMAAMPPGVMMWAGMYTVLFYVCGGMIAYMYRAR